MYQTLVNKNTGRIIQFVQGGTEARFDVHEGFMSVSYTHLTLPTNSRV